MTGVALLKGHFGRQWAVLAAALAVVCGLVGLNIHHQWQNILDRESERLSVQARVVGENVALQLDATSRALRGVADDLEVLRAAAGWPAVSRRLKGLTDAMAGVRSIVALDALGDVQATNRTEVLGRNFSGRQYFQEAKRDPNVERLYISPPFTTALGIFGINATRAMANPDGSFGGLITATLDLDYFRTLLSSILYAPDMWAAIAHADGLQFIMVPEREGQAGKNLSQPGSFFSRHRDSGRSENVLTGTVYATGEQRIMALRSIMPKRAPADKALVVAVGRDLGALRASWRRDAAVYGLLLAAIMVTAASGLFVYQHRRRAYDRLAAQAEAEQRRSEHQMLTVDANLRRSNAELEQFSYAISHDLQAPLRHIAGFLQLLERRYAPTLDDEGRSFIATAVEGAKRMSLMIHGLLEYSRVERMGQPFGAVDLGRAAGMAVDNLASMIEDCGGRVEIGLLPQVRGDEIQLMRLFQNLIGNALKFRLPDVVPVASVNAHRVDGEWEIAVRDNGIGVEPEQIKRLFGVFQRLHTPDAYEGSGIGLAVCRRIVERHGGRIALTSEGPGKGATVTFTLPTAE